MKTFGKGNEKTMRLNEYELCLKTLNNDMSIYVNALGVPIICGSLSGRELIL